MKDGNANGNAIAIYNIAAKHLQTAQVCVDRLHKLGATHELKLLTGRLQRLALWATPIEEGHELGGGSASGREGDSCAKEGRNSVGMIRIRRSRL